MARTPNIKRNQLVRKLANDGLSFAEIARALNLKSKSTVHWIFHYGRIEEKTVDK